MKKLAAMGLAAVLAVSMSFTALAGTWKQDNTGWWYQDDNGSYPVNTWRQIDGAWYFFDNTGYMVENQWIGNYYLGSGGAMLTNAWIQRFAGWYYYDNTGCMVKNQWIGNYYLGSNGVMLTNTITPDGYWVDADGAWIQEGDSSSNYTQITAEQEAKYDAKTEKIMTVMQAWNEKNIKEGYVFKGMTVADSVVCTWKSNSTLTEDNCCVSIIKGCDGEVIQNNYLARLWKDKYGTPTNIKVIGNNPGFIPVDTVTENEYAMVYMTQTGDVLGVAIANSEDIVLSVAGWVDERTVKDTWTNSDLRYKLMAPSTGFIAY